MSNDVAHLTDPDDDRDLVVEAIQHPDVVEVVLRGEGDIATLRDLEVALRHVDLGGARSVHLQVADLEFVDTATVRELIDFARQARQNGHEVRTCGANPVLRKVARLLDVEGMLGIS